MRPGWLRDAIVYEVFVDRFANGNRRLDPPNAIEWGAPPGATGFMGGDLAGIAGRLDYVADMGVSVLYLTPIFLASSNHRYNTYDYFTVDPRLGTLDDFRQLVIEVHRRGMRIMLDGVFNHCGRGFFPFFDVMENGAASAWAGWFHVEQYPVDAYGRHRFDGWLGAAEVPEINLANPDARAYMLRVAEYWTRQGIDGWRLDAVAHVRHRAFWRELRDVVRHANPEAYLLAEIWEDPTPWLGADFDGATNYEFRDAIVEFLFSRSLTASAFAERLERCATRHDLETAPGTCNLVGSHDTPRIWTLAGGDERVVRMALTLLFAFPGVPSLYYGDETGLEGGAEPDNRRAMNWDERGWNADLRPLIRQLASMRRSSRALREGNWETVSVDDRRGVCVFRRTAGDDECVLVVDAGSCEARLEGRRGICTAV